MIPQKVTVETSLRVFQYKLLNNKIYSSKRISKFDPAVNPLCSLCSQAPEDVVLPLSKDSAALGITPLYAAPTYYSSRSRSNSGSCR